MHLKFRNVNCAFRGLVQLFDRDSEEFAFRRTASRAGDVLQIDEPMIITYTRPTERVLFNKARDANPFFHMFESLWMLAGRRDVAPLLRYNSQIANVASDNGIIFNGAYGDRWKHYRTTYGTIVDQLPIIVDQLKRKPISRRCVLQVWNTEEDLLRIDETKDVCCNTHAYFSIRDGCLDMTVCNRSNDLIWGALGANVVHFSVLQEYLAACIGVQIGVYNQITNNLHIYLDRYRPKAWLEDDTKFNYDQHVPMALVENPSIFEEEIFEFINCTDWTRCWKEPFLHRVAAPMCWAFELHKRRNYSSSLSAVENIESEDWQFAARNWIEKRRSQWEQQRVATS